ncbi:hypothetical protein [Ruminococcus bicirculans (ex Wegman et al. 2014)]|uniref:hypothetical protein n=1 Tax=Ruminococcus bicirculans (ex Wegman et al. 2014) TaxID=1160721 RepID=UPI00307BE6B9
MITKEEFEKAVNCCTEFTVNCKGCPLAEKDLMCGVYFAEYLKENEPAPAATGTSSEVSVKEDTDNIHLNDSTLLDICQEGIEEMAKIALDDYPNEFLTGYIEAFKDNIKRLRGGQSD